MDTNKQQERGEKLDAQARELMSLPIAEYAATDHIEHAVAFLQVYSQTMGLAVEALGERIDADLLNTSIRFIIDAHLRIAEAKRG